MFPDGTERIEWGTCALCGVRIMHEGEWDDRHSSDDEDYHADCCMTIGPCSKAQPVVGWSAEWNKPLYREYDGTTTRKQEWQL